MKPKTFLFVAAELAFGEAVLGMRIAAELHARGHAVVVMAGAALSVLTEGTPYRAILVPPGGVGAGLAKLVVKAVADARADAVVLLDATLVYVMLKEQGTDATFLSDVRVPVLGLDVWNTRQLGLTWDVRGAAWEHSPRSLDVTRRLVPVPFAKPSGTAGLYDALPAAPRIADDDREETREDFGVGPKDRLLLLTSARWQHPAASASPDEKRLALSLPLLVSELVSRAGPHVKVAHVGPEAFPMRELGARYTWLSQRTPARFAKILASADVLLSFNFSATTISTAIAARLPVLLAVSSLHGDADAVVAGLPSPPSPALRAWIKKWSPLLPFRVWPLGLHRFLAPLAEDNPYTTTMRTVELLHEEAFVGELSSLLFDDAARARLREAQDAYARTVAALPKAADLALVYLR